MNLDIMPSAISQMEKGQEPHDFTYMGYKTNKLRNETVFVLTSI